MDDLIKRLIERRAAAWNAYKEFLDSVDAENRDLSGEEVEKDARFRADLDSLDTRIDEATKVLEANRRYAETSARVNGRNVSDSPPVEKDAVRAFFRGELRSLHIPIEGMRVERDSDGRYRVRETRDLGTVTPAAGGYLVPTDFRRQLVEFLTDNSAMRQTGATIITTSSGETLYVPKLLTHGTATIKGEGSAIGEADPSFARAALGAWKYGQLLQLPRELIQDNAVDLLGFVARDLGRALGEASGAHYVAGTGTTQPIGVMAVCGTGVTGGTAVSGAFTADNLIDLFYSVAGPYAARGTWLMKRATEGAVRKLKDLDNQYLWQPGLQVGAPNLLLGRPIVTDPNVAAVATSALSVAFGDFSGYWIRDVASVEIARSDDYAFGNDLVTYRAILRTDGALIDENAVKAFKGGAS